MVIPCHDHTKTEKKVRSQIFPTETREKDKRERGGGGNSHLPSWLTEGPLKPLSLVFIQLTHVITLLPLKLQRPEKILYDGPDATTTQGLKNER